MITNEFHHTERAIFKDGSRSARREARFLREFSERVQDSAFPLRVKETSESLKGLTRQRRNYGDSLIKAGVALLVIPDPITDAAAIPVLAAGKLLSSRQSSNLKDVYNNLSKSLSNLKNISSSL